MPTKVALTHLTHYQYSDLVTLGPQLVRLRPLPNSRTPILSYSLKLAPEKHLIHWQQDPLGNPLARVVLLERTTEFEILVELVAELTALNPFDFLLEPGAEQYPFTYPTKLIKDLEPYRALEPAGRLLQGFLDAISREPQATVSFLVDVNSKVANTVGYVMRLEPGIQSCEETLQTGSGSCRDSARLLVQVFRRLGLAARFVSGYLIQLAEKDTADLHAWVEVFLPGAGWIGLDPTSGLLAGEGHIPLACTPDPSNAAPVTGTVGPASVELTHSLSVVRLQEAPRTLMPYTEETWAEVERLAHKVDEGGVWHK